MTGTVSPPTRIAMWSGPRNISTALLRSFGNRPDAFVCDEPLYAHYLHVTGKPHPGAEEIIAAGETDWRRVVDWLTGDIPGGKTVFYQKHMAHHLLPNIGRDWLQKVHNCFLIRDPREMLTSLLKIIPEPEIEDTGLPQQVEMFRLVREQTGTIPPVLDSKDVLDNPEALLRALCDALGLEFTEAMLAWPPGPRETDGVWARHWYGEVLKSTSFRPFRPKPDPVPPQFEELHRQCCEHYEELFEHRLR